MAWQAFQLPKIPSGLNSAATALASITEALVSALNILTSFMGVVAKIPTSLPNPTQIIVSEAVALIEAALAALQNDAGVYVLFVPARRQVYIPAIVQQALTTIGQTSMPVAPVAASLATLQAQVTTADLSTVLSATGGNSGFARTVLESLVDSGDPNVPALADTDALTGFYVLAGSSDYSALLGSLTQLASIFGVRNPMAAVLDAPDLPAPQNLRARATTQGTLLSWTAPEIPTTLVAQGTNALVTQIAFIRSQSPSIMSARTVAEIFGSSTLTAGMTTGVGSQAVTVVDVQPYTDYVLNSSYVDTAKLDPGSYYYAATYNLTLGTLAELGSGGGNSLGFQKLSNTSKLYVEAVSTPAKTATSTPPDWYRTPSVISIIPDFSSLLDDLSAATAGFGTVSIGYGDMMNSQIAFLQKEILAYGQEAEALTAELTRLTSLLSNSSAGLYFRSFSGVGGTPFFAGDLVSSLAPTDTDPGRPPFDNNEFVGGMVVLASAPTLATLSPVVTLLQQLFGNLSPSAADPTATALSAIDHVLTTQEAVTFSDALTPTTATTPVTPPLIIGADDAIPGNTPNSPLQTPPAITFADDFTAIPD